MIENYNLSCFFSNCLNLIKEYATGTNAKVIPITTKAFAKIKPEKISPPRIIIKPPKNQSLPANACVAFHTSLLSNVQGVLIPIK